MKNANPLSRAIVRVALASAAFAVAACAKDGAGAADATASAAAARAPKTIADFFPIRVGDQTVRMQLAVRPAEMERGLMGRRDLGRDDGMIFVYERPQRMSFWMRNTPTPLDIGFFDAKGVLREVYPLHPFDERTVSSRGSELQFALEVNQGWFAERGVKPGAHLDLKALAAALMARGFDPGRFGM